jgi:uncharacterized cupin superfamily protein
MAKFTSICRDDVEAASTYQGPREVTGVNWSKALSPPGYTLWLCESELADGATITWNDRHGDDAVYVFEGELDVDGHRCPAGGAVIVESGAAATAKAVGTTRVAHYGPAADDAPGDGLFGPAKPDGHRVHVMGPGGHALSGAREGVKATWFADSTCDTCRCCLLLVENDHEMKAPSHHHSEDEIIYLIRGGITMGAYEFGEGTALSIPGNARYAFNGLAGGHAFLNFRRDVSNQTNGRDDEPMLETALARGGELVDDLR